MTTAPIITIEDVLTAASRLDLHRTNTRVEVGCAYSVDGFTPDCLVANIVNEISADLFRDRLAFSESSAFVALGDSGMTEDTVAFVDLAQRHADNYLDWGTALGLTLLDEEPEVRRDMDI